MQMLHTLIPFIYYNQEHYSCKHVSSLLMWVSFWKQDHKLIIWIDIYHLIIVMFIINLFGQALCMIDNINIDGLTQKCVDKLFQYLWAEWIDGHIQPEVTAGMILI